jgi:type VI secretion system FHA domain protein
MILTLEITGPQTGYIGGATRKVFDAAGGTIGRLPDNHWMLPDPHVSGRHAVIRYSNGTFYIEDTSTNGVFINTPDNRLTRGQQYPLKSGDRILIDLYEIRASITPGQPEIASDPFAAADPFPPVNARSPFPGDVPRYGAEIANELDPMKALWPEPVRSKPSPANAAPVAIDSLLSEHYKAPTPVPVAPSIAPNFIPDGYDPLLGDDRASAPPAAAPYPISLTPPPSRPHPIEARRSEPARTPAKTPPPHAAPSSADADVDLSAMLAAAGLDPGAVTPELARHSVRSSGSSSPA